MSLALSIGGFLYLVEVVNGQFIERINFLNMLIKMHIETQKCVQHLQSLVKSNYKWMVWFYECRYRLFGSLLGILSGKAAVIRDSRLSLCDYSSAKLLLTSLAS